MESVQEWSLFVNYFMEESCVCMFILMRLVMWMIENKGGWKLKEKKKCTNSLQYVQVYHVHDKMYIHIFGCMI